MVGLWHWFSFIVSAAVAAVVVWVTWAHVAPFLIAYMRTQRDTSFLVCGSAFLAYCAAALWVPFVIHKKLLALVGGRS